MVSTKTKGKAATTKYSHSLQEKCFKTHAKSFYQVHVMAMEFIFGKFDSILIRIVITRESMFHAFIFVVKQRQKEEENNFMLKLKPNKTIFNSREHVQCSRPITLDL